MALDYSELTYMLWTMYNDGLVKCNFTELDCSGCVGGRQTHAVKLLSSSFVAGGQDAWRGNRVCGPSGVGREGG